MVRGYLSALSRCSLGGGPLFLCQLVTRSCPAHRALLTWVFGPDALPNPTVAEGYSGTMV